MDQIVQLQSYKIATIVLGVLLGLIAIAGIIVAVVIGALLGLVVIMVVVALIRKFWSMYVRVRIVMETPDR